MTQTGINSRSVGCYSKGHDKQLQHLTFNKAKYESNVILRTVNTIKASKKHEERDL